MINLGMVPPGSTIVIPYDTYDGGTGASATQSGFAASDIEIYRDGSVTQRSSDSGYTLLDTDGIDFDGLTGINGFSVSLADNTDAGFYRAGSTYFVVVASVTVDAQTVNFVAATFTIGYPGVLNTSLSSVTNQTTLVLTNGPAEDDALNGMDVVIHGVASAVQLGRAVIADYVGSTKTVTLAAATTFTVAANDNITVLGPSALQPTIMGRTLDVSTTGEAGLDWSNIGAPTTTVNLSGTTVKTATDVETDTADIQSRLPAALVSGRIDSSVGAIAANAITAAAAAADFGAEIADAVWDEALSGHVTAGTAGQALYGARSGTAQAGAATTITLDASASATNDIYNYQLIVITGGTGAGQARIITDYDGTTKVATVNTWQTNPASDSVFLVIPFGQIPGATAPTAAEVADAVWDEATAGHTTAGTFGEQLKTDVDAILADTNELQVDWANGGRLDLIIDDILLDTGTTLDDLIDTEVAAILTAVDTEIADIQSRLPAALVSGRIDASVGAMAANVMTAAAAAADLSAEIADAVWDEATSGHTTAGSYGKAVPDIEVDTTAIEADTQDIQSRLPAALTGGRIDASVGAMAANVITAAAAAADFGAEIADAVLDEALAGHSTAGSLGKAVTDIEVDTSTTLQGELDGIQADTEDIQARLPAALVSGRMSSDMVAVSGDTVAADRLEAALDGTVTGSVNDAAATTTSFVTDLSSAVNDYYNGRLLTFTSGVLTGQQVEITDYVGATKTVTVSATTSAPANTVTFVIT